MSKLYLSLFAVLSLFQFSANVASARGGEELKGMGGGMKGIGGMGGGMKGVGGMGGGFKGIGGMGGGMKGIGGMGGGCRGVSVSGADADRARNQYNSRYGEYNTRYGEHSTRYGGTAEDNEVTSYGETTGRYGMPVEDSNSNTRYGFTTGRYGEPVNGSADNSLAARYERVQSYGRMMNQLGAMRSGATPYNQAQLGAGSMMNRMRELEQHPPTGFNRIYVP